MTDTNDNILTTFEISSPTFDLALREAWLKAKNYILERCYEDDRAPASGRLVLVGAEVVVSPFSIYADDCEPTFKFELRRE